jgi:aminoglycoside phosphotransferase (APT) family kinase protein
MAARRSPEVSVVAAASERIPNLEEVRAEHRFDEHALARYLKGRLAGGESRISIRQFKGGQSNPTFLLTTGDGHRYVLRKKPPGDLLPKAHQVEREYRVMAALADTAVPVPTMRLLCESDEVIGTAFFVMDFVEGATAQEPLLELPKSVRSPVFFDAVKTMALLHKVDWQEVGLAGFGRPDNYVPRQIDRWSKQYEASRTDADIPAMGWLRDWLVEHGGVADETAIAHGDFRLGNMIIDLEQFKVAAVLDWELSTLGHPLADLAYLCMPYHLPAGADRMRGVIGLDLAEIGIPTEAEILAAYCKDSGRADIADWSYFLAFSLFRMAAILQGVAARAVQGNASSADARLVGGRAGMFAEAGKKVAEAAG